MSRLFGRVLCALGLHRWVAMARWDFVMKSWRDLSRSRCTRCGLEAYLKERPR